MVELELIARNMFPLTNIAISSTPAPGDRLSTLSVQLFLDSIKWYYAVFVFLWLTCFTYHDAFKIYLFIKMQDTLIIYDWTNFIYIITVYVIFLLYSFLHQWTLGLFPCLGYSELYDRPMFNFFEKLSVLFSMILHHLHFHQQVTRVLFFHIFTNTCYLFLFILLSFWLHRVFLAARSSSCGERGQLRLARAFRPGLLLLRRTDSRRRLQQLRFCGVSSVDSVVTAHGPEALRHVESSRPMVRCCPLH